MNLANEFWYGFLTCFGTFGLIYIWSEYVMSDGSATEIEVVSISEARERIESGYKLTIDDDGVVEWRTSLTDSKDS